jgi:hypothetical protein
MEYPALNDLEERSYAMVKPCRPRAGPAVVLSAPLADQAR